MSWTLSHHSDCSLATTFVRVMMFIIMVTMVVVVVSQMNLVIMTMVTMVVSEVNLVIMMAKTWRASSGAESGPFLTSGLADSRGSELQWQCL